MKKVIFLLLIMPATVWPKNGCGSVQPEVYFANGMFNSPEAAKQSAVQLGDFLQKNKLNHDIANPNNTHLSYNTNEAAWTELNQVIEQKFASELDHFFFNAARISAAPSFLQKIISTIEEKYTSLIVAEDSDLDEQVQEYTNSLGYNPVLVIAHSQGNMYSNLAHANLKSKVTDIDHKFMIHSVATPNSFVAGQGTYTTLTSDGVIKLVPRSLPGNISNSNPGFFDHEFANHYLNGNQSGPRISEQIKFLISKIEMKIPLQETRFDGPTADGNGPFLSQRPEFYATDFWSIRLWLANRLHDKKELLRSECLLLIGVGSIMFRNFHVCKERSRETLKKSFLTSKNFSHGKTNADGKFVYPDPWNGVMELNFIDTMIIEIYPDASLPIPPEGLEVRSDISSCIRLKSTEVSDADFAEAATLVDSIPIDYRP